MGTFPIEGIVTYKEICIRRNAGGTTQSGKGARDKFRWSAKDQTGKDELMALHFILAIWSTAGEF